jgi:NAD(P)-dependent dehydrogenase (short-subunit alcohol dehydrogenase family)
MKGRPVAVVTGTSRGLGVAIAEDLLSVGYDVVGISRSASPIRHERFVHSPADISKRSASEELVEGVVDRFGRIDILVNNAAEIFYAPCWKLLEEDLQRLLDTNLTAPFTLSREVVRHWLAVGAEGSVVNICSIESEVAWLDPPQAGYALTKGGLAGLTRSMAYELARFGIRVNGIAPGVIDTDMTPPATTTSTPEIPLGRRARPEEIARYVTFVGGPESTYTTGEIIYVDGGFRLP